MIHKKIINLALACLLIGSSNQAFCSKGDNNMTQQMQSVKATYQWFNSISSLHGSSYSKDDVSQYFTEDAQMITNGQVICTGVIEHYEHFVELIEYYQSLQVDIEKIDMRQSGDRVYLHYVLYGKNKQSEDIKIHVMGYMVVKHGKIQIFNEVISKEV